MFSLPCFCVLFLILINKYTHLSLPAYLLSFAFGSTCSCQCYRTIWPEIDPARTNPFERTRLALGELWSARQASKLVSHQWLHHRVSSKPGEHMALLNSAAGMMTLFEYFCYQSCNMIAISLVLSLPASASSSSSFCWHKPSQLLASCFPGLTFRQAFQKKASCHNSASELLSSSASLLPSAVEVQLSSYKLPSAPESPLPEPLLPSDTKIQT